MTEVVMGNVAHYKKIIAEKDAEIARLKKELIDARSDLGYQEDDKRGDWVDRSDWVTYGG